MERDDSLSGPKAYLNLYFATSKGFKLGDKITMEVPALETKEYTIAGIYEAHSSVPLSYPQITPKNLLILLEFGNKSIKSG